MQAHSPSSRQVFPISSSAYATLGRLSISRCTDIELISLLNSFIKLKQGEWSNGKTFALHDPRESNMLELAILNANSGERVHGIERKLG
jgi:hypothetical protein